jgi:hypothetical protein
MLPTMWQAPDSDFELEYAKRGVSAAQVVALLDTQSAFDLLLKIPYPTTQARVLEKLQDEKLVARDNGHYHITYLGALLFAKNLADFGLERKAVRVIKYQGAGKLHTEKDQIGILGYGNGFLRVMNYLSALLPSNEVIEAAIRREVRMYPPLAVRELVANAHIPQTPAGRHISSGNGRKTNKPQRGGIYLAGTGAKPQAPAQPKTGYVAPLGLKIIPSCCCYTYSGPLALKRQLVVGENNQQSLSQLLRNPPHPFLNLPRQSFFFN